jgi:molybdate transport system substrate-binding protein
MEIPLVRSLFLLLALWPGANAAELIVACASDLAPAQEQLASAFKKSTGTVLRFVTGSSGMLARQVSSGAPFDIYLSANRMYVEDLVRDGSIVSDSVRTYGTGRLGLWSLSGKIGKLDDLKKAEVKHVAIANPAHAPYGVAAKQALEKAGLWKSVEPKIVYGENVRQAMQYAESGNADAVITSWTLLLGRGVELPADLHAPIEQAGGIVARSKQQNEAKRFLDFLVNGDGAPVLKKFGLR